MDATLDEYSLVQTALSGYRDLLSVQDLVKIFGVSKQTVYKEIKNGKFGTPIYYRPRY